MLINHSKIKTALYKEKFAKTRKQHAEVIERFNPQKLIYVDESGIDSYISREYGWDLRGKKVMGNISGKRYARESFVAGFLGKEVIDPTCYQ